MGATADSEKSPRTPALTILIAEDEEVVRALAAAVLQREGFVVIPACNAEAAIEVFRSGLNIDALLADMQMGSGLTGIMLAEYFLRERPGLGVLVMSGFPDTERMARERNIPFMAKPFDAAQLVERMRQIVAPRLAACVAEAPAPIPKNILTARETKVLVLITEGLSTKKIAQQLGISVKTVACHRSHIMQKLNVNNAVSLVRYAIRHNLITP